MSEAEIAEWLPDARILIVDDDPMNISLLEQMLGRAGYSNILSATDPRTAATLFEAFQPDILLLDWLMPYLTGREVLRDLRPLIPGQSYPPILVLTADITRETRASALAEGAKDFLLKPVDATELALRVHNLLETRYLHLALVYRNGELEREIHERRRAEVALRRSEEKFRAMFVGAPDMVLLIDQAGVIVDANPAVQAILGYAPESLMNRPIAALLAEDAALGHVRAAHAQDLPADPAAGDRWLALVLERGQHMSMELISRADHTLCPADVMACVITWGDQRHVLAVLRDATTRLRAEMDIRNALAREQELSQLKTNFIAMTSHEFRTPLSTILSSAELLEHYGHRWSEQKRITHVQRIKDSISQMMNLLNNVLFIGRADHGRLAAVAGEVELHSFCRDVVEELEHALRISGRVEIHAPGDALRVVTDARLLRQIVINLLSNAVKYSAPESVVTLEISADQRLFQLSVIDHGIGIPLEDQPRLYEEFHRAANVEHVSGTGLGLAIVKRSVDALRGTIECVSELGVGTTFRVSIPRHHAAPEVRDSALSG